jgi:acetyl esterase/lipase
MAAALAFSISTPLRAQDAMALLNSSSIQTVKNLEYAKPNGHPLALDLYIPKGVAKPMPVVLWVHGGGWMEGNKDIPWILPLAPLGFAVASIDYRLVPYALWPAQIYDCKAAVRWLRSHASDYGIDPNRIGAVGASAGGQLVALLGLTANNPELEGNEGVTGVSSAVQAVCDFFGPTNFTDLGREYSLSSTNFVAGLLGGPIVKNWDEARRASPVNYVSAQACPFFVAHGDRDRIVPIEQSQELVAALKKAGVPCTFYVARGGGHGFRDPAAFADAVAFLEKYLVAKK